MSTNAPTSIRRPPSRTISTACANEPGKPVALTTRSTPSPSVRSRTSAATAGSAPASRAARSSRRREGSTAMIRPAPISDALIACASPSAPTPMTATDEPGPEARRARQPRRALEAVGDREDLGQHRHVVRQPLGHAEHRRARLEVEEVRPAAEQMRRVVARERVAVVLDVAAEVVREPAGAHPALPAGAVGRRHDAVADRQRRAVAGARAAVADRGHDADVLVALDDRVGRRARVLGARVLLGLAAVGVLVGPADPRGEHPQQHRARLDLVGVGIRADLELPGAEQRRRLNGGGHAPTLPHGGVDSARAS